MADCISINERNCNNNTRFEISNVSKVAFIIVPLNVSVESYWNILRFPYINQVGNIPASVHFSIDTNGIAYQYESIKKTAFGLNAYNSPTFPNRPIPTPSNKTGLNERYVFIGVECDTVLDLNFTGSCDNPYVLNEKQIDSLALLLCCKHKELGLIPSNDTITDGYNLNVSLVSYRNPTTLLHKVISLFQDNCRVINTEIANTNATNSGNGSNNPNETCLDCKDSTCCPEHTVKINAQNLIIESLVADNVTLNNNLSLALGRIEMFERQITGLNTLIRSLLSRFEEIDDCFRCLCSQSTNSEVIEYEQAGSENEQILVPFAPTKLRVPIQISDTMPASVTNTSYFNAILNRNNCIPKVDITVSLGLSDYNRNSQVTLTMFVCGVPTVIASRTITGSGAVTLQALDVTMNVTSPTCDVYFEVMTTDNKTPSKKIIYSRIKIYC
jgi:hypothetical protein